MPVVSVILPTFNPGGFLAEAIDSICGQSLADIEVLIVDGGSTDGSRAYMARRAAGDRRIRLLEGDGQGLVAALELGRRSAVSAYIARMDADDVAHPDRLAWQLSFLQQNPSVVAVGGQVELIDAEGRWLGRGRFPRTAAACTAQLARSAPFCHPAVLMRAAAVEAVGGYRSAAYPAEDYDLWLRLSRVGAFANLDRTVLLYRKHGNSGTSVHAHANAVAVVKAVIAARSDGAEGEGVRALAGVPPTTPWDAIEPRIPSEDRLFARAVYLRAMAVNGGIGDGPAAGLFLRSVDALARAAVDSRHDRRALAFAINRGALNLSRKRRWKQAGGLLIEGFRHLPSEMVADFAVASWPLASSTTQRLWMRSVHRYRRAKWTQRFVSAMKQPSVAPHSFAQNAAGD